MVVANNHNGELVKQFLFNWDKLSFYKQNCVKADMMRANEDFQLSKCFIGDLRQQISTNLYELLKNHLTSLFYIAAYLTRFYGKEDSWWRRFKMYDLAKIKEKIKKNCQIFMIKDWRDLLQRNWIKKNHKPIYFRAPSSTTFKNIW